MGPEAESVYSARRNGVRFFPLHSRGIAPQALEVVVLALLLTEDVDDDVHVVEEHPLPPVLALASDGLDAQTFANTLLDLLDQRADLAVAGTRGDHEVIGDHDQLADVQDHDVARLLGRRRLRRRDGRRSAVVHHRGITRETDLLTP